MDTTADLAPDRRGGDVHPLGVIGHYKLLGVLGEGGFGVVYEAEQIEPVRRRVALKLIKPGMDSAAVVARFEAERQALAVMDHPCIAKVLDGGVAGPDFGNRPYFVMELVKGVPITEHCDTQQLTIDERCELFIRVCEAVQHAHTKGVVHRDLKPSNVLVSYSDEGHAVPKVIDFGVAKALNQRLSEKTIYTERGQLIGTPEYMSPEQAEMSEQDIDTRADVYSLGVLLYELLTGVLPFDRATLREAAFNEIQRIIRETDPPRPSTRLSTLLSAGKNSRQIEQIVKTRKADLRSLTGVLRQDLDWVIMRSLEKDRDRRYQTATAMGDELRRYIEGEPVKAGPPNAIYRMEKFYKRNRVGVIVVSVGAIVILSLAVVSSAGYLRIKKADDAKAKALANESRALASEREKTAELNIAITEIQSYLDAENDRLSELAGQAVGIQDVKQNNERLLQLISDNSIDLTELFERPQLITVHHSGLVFYDTDLEKTVTHIRQMRTEHIRRGWFDIGYHFIVDTAGRVWVGRSLLEEGAHVKGMNAGNIGVLVLGDYYEQDLTTETAQATIELLQRLCLAFEIDKSRVYVHQDLMPTRDPGPPLRDLVHRYKNDADLSLPIKRFDSPQYPQWIKRDIGSLIESITLVERKNGYSIEVSTNQTILDAPLVGRIEIHLVDLSGASVQVPEFEVKIVSIPEISAIWPSYLDSQGIPISNEAVQSTVANGLDGNPILLEWLGGMMLDKAIAQDLPGVIHEGVARVEIHPDKLLGAALRETGLNVPEEAMDFEPIVKRYKINTIR
ncbi:MAG: protein kinase [Phycisphaerales bacterium]|nr:protein kinase [Phycisphaerales bacterium]